MGLQHIAEQIKADNYWMVTEDTFGHLAPMQNKTYRGFVTCAVSHYNDLNPIIMDIKLDDLEDSPWLYDVVKELLSDIGNEVLKAGNLYQIRITFRNYRIWHKVMKLKISTNGIG